MATAATDETFLKLFASVHFYPSKNTFNLEKTCCANFLQPVAAFLHPKVLRKHPADKCPHPTANPPHKADKPMHLAEAVKSKAEASLHPKEALKTAAYDFPFCSWFLPVAAAGWAWVK